MPGGDFCFDEQPFLHLAQLSLHLEATWQGGWTPNQTFGRGEKRPTNIVQ